MSARMKLCRAQLQAGLTLVELMVALALTLFILIGLVTLFANQSVSRTEIDKASRQIENGRFAVQTLVSEINLAGYFGPLMDAPVAPGAVPDPCANSAASVSAAIGIPLQGYAGAGADPTPGGCLTGYKANTAVLVVRRASTSTSAAFTSGEFNIQVSGCQGDSAKYLVNGDSTAANFTLHKRTSATSGCALPLTSAASADIAPLYVHIYYITTCSNKDDCTASGADSVPTLRRIDVKPAGVSTPVALVDGIENLQLEYGLDTDSDGAPNSYTSTAPTTVANWRNVMSMRVSVLARNIDVTGGYTDTKTYDLGAASVTPGGSYKRHAYNETARLNNPAGRRE